MSQNSSPVWWLHVRLRLLYLDPEVVLSCSEFTHTNKKWSNHGKISISTYISWKHKLTTLKWVLKRIQSETKPNLHDPTEILNETLHPVTYLGFFPQTALFKSGLSECSWHWKLQPPTQKWASESQFPLRAPHKDGAIRVILLCQFNWLNEGKKAERRRKKFPQSDVINLYPELSISSLMADEWMNARKTQIEASILI